MAKVKGTPKFGMLLRKLRNQKGLGVNQLASYIGISGAEISRIERGERKKIAPDLLRELAPRLGVSYEYLMQEAGYLPGKAEEKGEPYQTTADPLTGLSQKDRKLVLDLIERLRQK
jgi:transcriptional regulator with XRE-family HTH domain